MYCSRVQPVYGVVEWAAGFAPELFELWPEEVALLHDDRLGRALDRLFDSVGPELILAVVRQVVREFPTPLPCRQRWVPAGPLPPYNRVRRPEEIQRSPQVIRCPSSDLASYRAANLFRPRPQARQLRWPLPPCSRPGRPIPG
jgi:hypothetical protein